MNAKHVLASALAMGSFALAIVACGSIEGALSDEAVDGGLLYDKWWEVASVDEPMTDHPLWAGQSTNERTGADTHRCKECHGWDYRGADGAYGSGSHFTGFPGILSAADKTARDLTSVLTSGDHDFSALGDDAVASLVAFIQEGTADYSPHIDADTGAVVGADLDNGAELFSGCQACHGADGRQLNFGSDDEPEYLGDLAADNPWETFHKVQFGHPGSQPEMPSAATSAWTLEEVRDVVAYSQTLAGD